MTMRISQSILCSIVVICALSACSPNLIDTDEESCANSIRNRLINPETMEIADFKQSVIREQDVSSLTETRVQMDELREPCKQPSISKEVPLCGKLEEMIILLDEIVLISKECLGSKWRCYDTRYKADTRMGQKKTSKALCAVNENGSARIIDGEDFREISGTDPF